jgi:hypothetical protein
MERYRRTAKWAASVVACSVAITVVSAQQAQQTRPQTATRSTNTGNPQAQTTSTGRSTTVKPATPARPGNPAPQSTATAPTGARMTNQDVIDLVKAGFSEELVVATLNGPSEKAFDVTTRGLLMLKNAGVSERVIALMIRGPGVAITRTTPAGLSNGSAATPAPDSSSPSTPASGAAPSLPSEVGVYVASTREYMEVEPEIVNWKTGGFLKRFATGGLLGGHVNGWVNRPTSGLAVPPGVEFVLVTPEGTAASEYQLLKLDAKSSRREFRALTMNIIGAQSGSERNQIQFRGERVRPRTYRVQLTDLAAGEYGFLPPFAINSSAGSIGKIYAFTVR